MIDKTNHYWDNVYKLTLVQNSKLIFVITVNIIGKSKTF